MKARLVLCESHGKISIVGINIAATLLPLLPLSLNMTVPSMATGEPGSEPAPPKTGLKRMVSEAGFDEGLSPFRPPRSGLH